MQITLLLTLALAACGGLAQQLDKPAAWNNLDLFHSILNNLPPTTTRISQWPNDTISKGCRDRVLGQKKDPALFTSYTVYFGDCEMPWYICRERGALPTIVQMADSFARVPVGMRQYVGDLVHFKDGEHADAWENIVALHGHLTGKRVPVMIHEASHCVDSANGMGINSSDQTWLDAYNRDSHVADKYARTSHVENFAQYANLIIYDRISNKSLQAKREYPWIWHQIHRMAQAADSNQIWGNRMFDITISGKKCGFRWALTHAVNPTTGAVVEKSEVPFIAPRNPGIIIKEGPELNFLSPGAGLTNCSFAYNEAGDVLGM